MENKEHKEDMSFINDVYKRSPYIFNKAKELQKDLGLNGIWEGTYRTLSKIIKVLIEVEKNSLPS